jgi:hypothetical protein
VRKRQFRDRRAQEREGQPRGGRERKEGNGRERKEGQKERKEGKGVSGIVWWRGGKERCPSWGPLGRM